MTLIPGRAHAQDLDSLATVRLRILHRQTPLAGVGIAVRGTAVATDPDGRTVLRLRPGLATLIVSRIGYVPVTLSLSLRAGQDTSVTVDLEAQPLELENVVVAATRSERRVEDTPCAWKWWMKRKSPRKRP